MSANRTAKGVRLFTHPEHTLTMDATPVVDHDGDSIITDDSPSPQPKPSSSRASVPVPSGPICSYGTRLGYTYFAAPAPSPDLLNSISEAHEGAEVEGEASRAVHWFTVDDQLLYLSFFMDSGPLNAACL